MPKTSVLKPYKVAFNQPLSVPVVPKYLPPIPAATPLLKSKTPNDIIADDNISYLDDIKTKCHPQQSRHKHFSSEVKFCFTELQFEIKLQSVIGDLSVQLNGNSTTSSR